MTKYFFNKCTALVIVSIFLILSWCAWGTKAFSQSAAPAQSSSEEQSGSHACIELFKKGLAEADEFKGNVMTGVAISQGIKEPKLAESLWTVLQNDMAKNVPLEKVQQAAWFLEHLDSAMDQCSMADFEPMWKLRNAVNEYIQSVVDSETGKAIALLKSKTTDEIVKTVRGKEGANVEIANARQTLDLYEKIGICETDSEAYDEIQKDVYNVLFDQLCAEYNKCAARLEELKKETNPNKFLPKKDKEGWSEGASHVLLAAIQDFAQDYAKYSNSFDGYIEDKGKIQKLRDMQREGSKLLENAVLLNQVRYNLWANWLIYNRSKDDYKAFATISRDQLSPEVMFMYEKKLGEILNESKPGDPTILYTKVHTIILTEKVPLSAF